MEKVRIFFISGDGLDVDWDTWLLIEKADMDQFYTAGKPHGFAAINPRNITHVVFLEPYDATSDVITPLKPAEVRQERQRDEENRDVTLDAQLSNPELGNE